MITIPIISVPGIVLASICLTVGLHYLMIFYHKRDDLTSLYFFLTCVSIAIYDLLSAGLYGAVSVTQGIIFQRFQLASLSLFSISITFFAFSFTERGRSRVPLLVASWFSLFIILGFLLKNRLTLTDVSPAVKQFSLLGYNVVFNEAQPGIIYGIQYISMLFLSVCILSIIWRYYHSEKGSKAAPLAIAMILFCLCAVNDTLIGIGIYHFFYISEYAYLGIIVSMAYILQQNAMDLSREIEELNARLEEKINERTINLVISELSNDLYRISNPAQYGAALKDAEELTGLRAFKSPVKDLVHDISIISNGDVLMERALAHVLDISGASFGQIYIKGNEGRPVLILEKGVPENKSDEYSGEHSGPGGILTLIESLCAPVSLENGVAPCAAVPVMLNGEAVGACYFEKPPGSLAFTAQDLSVLSSFVSRMAVIMENAFLYQRMVNRQRSIDRMGKALSVPLQKKIEQVIRYIEENYRSDISRDGLASSMNLHPDSLGRYFKMHTGLKIGEYINELRIREAASLLASTNDTVITIAFSTGFESLPTFNRAFQKVMSMTPTEYRDKHNLSCNS